MKRLFIIFVLLASANAQVIFQTVAGSAQAQVARPDYDHDTASYSGSVTVTITDATSGAAGKYCTAVGSDCDPSGGTTIASFPVSPSAITVDQTHLCSYATKAGMTQSATKCATYTITAGGIARVGTGAHGGSDSGNTTVSTGTLDVGANNLLYCVVGTADTGGCSGTITLSDTNDTNTAKFVQIGTNISRAYQCSAHFYAKGTAAKLGDTITATFSDGFHSYPTIACEQFSGLSTTSPLDASGTKNDHTTNPLKLQFTTNFADELIFYSATDYYVGGFTANQIGGDVNCSGGTTSTLAHDYQNSGGTIERLALSFVIVSSTQSGVYACLTENGGTWNANSMVATFK